MDNLGNKKGSSVWQGRLLRSALLGSACLASLTAIPAVAQDQAGNEVVVVTGIRGSLQQSLDIKRQSVGVVDAITAEDIGKFPDTNLAESMMRIPGVTVTRGVTSGSSTGAVTTTGEATAITVRGFGPSYNQTLFDGRQVPSALGNTQGNAAGDRSFDFSSLNSDFVSQIKIMKSPDASLSSGAIGATIDIKFPKPLDRPGLVLAGSFSGSVSPERGTWTPNGDVILSNTFANDTFGILVAGSYANSAVRQNHINIQGWNGVTTGTGGNQINPAQYAGTPPPDGSPNYFIQDYGIFHERTTVERMQGRLVLQWRPTDALEITVNDNFSRFNTKQSQYGYSVWFNAGSLQQVETNDHGTIVSFIQPATPTDFQGQINGQVLQFNDIGANVKWTVSDNLSFTFDFDHGEAWLNPGGQFGAVDADIGYGGVNAVDLSIVVPAGHALPFPSTFGPAGDKTRFVDPAIIGSHVFPITSNQNLDTINQFKAEGLWSQDKLDIKFGFQFIGEHKNEDAYDTFGNNNWQAYSGYGPPSGSAAGVDLPDEFFANTFSTRDFINGWSGSENLPPEILAVNAITIRDYLEGLNGAGANNCCALPTGADPNAPENAGRPFNGTFVAAFNPSAHHVLMEKTYAGYVTGTFKTDLADMPLTVNAGARYEITKVEVVGIGRLPTAFTVQVGDPTAYDVAFGPSGDVTGESSYQHLLPNLDLILSVTDDIDIRFNASRTLTRPPIGLLNPVFNLSATRLNNVTANGGNPDLKPFLSDNLDLGAQWYYQQNSFISFDTFLKTVSNFIVQGSTQQVFFGVGPGGTDIPYTLTSPVNGPAANVYGLEASWQHVFGETGFGFQVNGTLVDTDKPYDPQNRFVSNFAVTGLANSANFVGFYDKEGFQARFAINWQDSYLDRFGQLQNGSQFGTEPTFVNGSWNMDFSTSYDITEQITGYFEAKNLTDATYSTHGRFPEQILDVVDYGRRFIVGVHFKY